jgi:hypothetical protein
MQAISKVRGRARCGGWIRFNHEDQICTNVVMRAHGANAVSACGGQHEGTYLATFYQRLAARRGRKRAIIAVAHSMVVNTFHMLSCHDPYGGP